jgi:putative phosphoribosyl transferase
VSLPATGGTENAMSASGRFRDRREAGKALAALLTREPFADPIVLALPRGGVPVGYEVAAALAAPLEAFVARKIGAPGHEELGIGAIAEGSDEIVVAEAAHRLGVDRSRIEQLAERERHELDRRVETYRRGASLPELGGRDVVVVDDGLATGVTAEAALRSIRRRNPAHLVLGVPVCAAGSARLAPIARVVSVVTPADFHAVGEWYDDFSPTTDAEVIDLLQRARASVAGDRP